MILLIAHKKREKLKISLVFYFYMYYIQKIKKLAYFLIFYVILLLLLKFTLYFLRSFLYNSNIGNSKKEG